jgi:triphosphoribosyl-dephospho-CoA synthase
MTPCGSLSLAELIETACAMEVMSPKPGNVAPGQEFAGASIDDFLKSARAIGPVLAAASEQSLGETILKSVRATREVVNHNTNLGIILLLSPLAKVPRSRPLEEGIFDVLDSTTVADSRLVYEAIRMAQPAGLGEAAEQDLNHEPTLNLQECMRLAADRDMVAAQYVNGFQQVLTCGQEWLQEALTICTSQPEQISWLAVRLLAEFGDSLIARKCGQQMSDVVREKAKELLDGGWPIQHHAAAQFGEFDRFLREDGNRRNPGTTADLVAAILFSALRDGLMIPVGDWFNRKTDC